MSAFILQLILFLITNKLFEGSFQILRIIKDNQAVRIVDPSYLPDMVLRYTIFFKAETIADVSSLHEVNSIDHDCHPESLISKFIEIRLNLRVEEIVADVKVNLLFEKFDNLFLSSLLFVCSSARKFSLNDCLHQSKTVLV